MRRNTRRTPIPIYTFAAVWLLYALFFPLLRLGAFLTALGLALAAAIAVGRALALKAGRSAAETEPAEEPKEADKPASPSYSPEVESIIADGKLAMKEMGRLYGSIRNETVRGKINELMAVSDKIVRDAVDDPSDVPQIRKFLDFYLPTTIKLLNAYDRMDAQGVEGENITGTKRRIEDMLDTTIAAYKKQLDALFANQAMDIDSDIRAMSGMLSREGLGGKSYLDLKEFMKEYEKQKGSAQNG